MCVFFFVFSFVFVVVVFFVVFFSFFFFFGGGGVNEFGITIMCRCEYSCGKIFADVKNLYRFLKKLYNCHAIGKIRI